MFGRLLKDLHTKRYQRHYPIYQKQLCVASLCNHLLILQFNAQEKRRLSLALSATKVAYPSPSLMLPKYFVTPDFPVSTAMPFPPLSKPVWAK
jgi:hypothetical protein